MLKRLKKAIRDTHFYAYCQGYRERRRYGDAAGRTHDTDQGWNEAYDRGQNFAEWAETHLA